MIDLQRAIGISRSYALIGEKSKHTHWQRTQDLYRKYRAFVTGDDLEYLVKPFDRRESKEDFEQMMRIVKQVAPATVSALMNPPRKVAGIRPQVDRIDYGKENDPNADALKKAISTFYGGQSVDHYLNTLVDPSDIDPNAFQLLTFDDFDARFEKPTVYPLTIPSANVWAFSYLNGELEWLWMGFEIRYVTKESVVVDGKTITPEETAKGLRMVFYTHEHHVVYEQVDKGTAQGLKDVITDADGNPLKTPTFSDGKGSADYFLRTNDETLYRVRFYEQKSGRVPAFRLGCKADPLTNGVTCVNRWHEALPHLEKNLKHTRELDLTVSLHVFLQKHQYVSRCMAKGCNGGFNSAGTECGNCKGSGFTTIGTAQDHITLPLPRPGDPMHDLAKLAHYVPLPIDIVTKLMEIVKEDRSDAFKAVYGSDLYGQGQVGKTYEEVIAQNQGVYDALQPFAQWWAGVRTLIVQVYAAYNDKDKGLNVVYKLPRSFGFENAATTFAMMKAGREAGASKAILANLNASVLSIVFRDDSQAMAKAQTQAKFDPFPGMTEDTIAALISGGKASEKSAMLWTESATVFARAEAMYVGQVSFYELAESKQREVIDKIVEEMLEENTPEPVDIGQVGVDEQEMKTQEGEELDPDADPLQEQVVE